MACLRCDAAEGPDWTLAQSKNFEIYSQSGPAGARSALAAFEQLRSFFLLRSGGALDSPAVLRVIIFGSRDEYNRYRLQPNAGAYYVGTQGRHTIVMPSFPAADGGIAAHEYVHFLIDERGLKLPRWLAEGLAEFFSSLRISERGSSIGAALPLRLQTLRQSGWLPLAELTSANDRQGGIFYAQSWALVHMLVLSPRYSQRLTKIFTAMMEGTSADEAFTAAVGPFETVTRDLHEWVNRPSFRAVPLPGIISGAPVVRLSTVSGAEARIMLAKLLLDTGDLDRAGSMLHDLAKGSPQNADIAAALGTIALQRGNTGSARSHWRRAIELGIADAGLCYRYAILAESAGLPAPEIRTVLQRAISLKPDFDDARYSLGLSEMNAGHYEQALDQFRAMRSVAPVRGYAYWSAVANVLNELERHEEAKAAALKASAYAANGAERAHAAQLAYVADTDLVVRFTRDANGKTQLATARAPRNRTGWNPFIEQGDRMQRSEGRLQEIDCAGGLTRLKVITVSGPIDLVISDPSRVQMRNAPAEFTCGPQPDAQVVVDYTVPENIIRGVEFR